MKIAISNIAWNHYEDKSILKLLKKHLIAGIEVAPTKIWDNPTNVSKDTINKYRKFWENEGINIVAIQALLFGHPELTLFEDSKKRKNTLTYIEKMVKVSSLLGAKVVVFGSPKNRHRKDIKIKKALDIASHFFYKVGEIAKLYDIYFCIEPNPMQYGTNFVNNTKEALELIKLVNHPNFMLHLDSGTLTLNKENYYMSINNGFSYMKHFHVSEENLIPIGKSTVDHKKISKILKNLYYDRWVSIEMIGNNNASNYKTVEDALKFVSTIY